MERKGNPAMPRLVMTPGGQLWDYSMLTHARVQFGMYII